MKTFLLILLVPLAGLAGEVQPGPIPPLSDLRLAIQQSQASGAATTGPRQLTAQERAELRRQIQQLSRRPPKP